MTTINIPKLRKKVIKLYEDYLSGKDVSEEANRTYKTFLTAGPVLDRCLNEAMNLLFAFTRWGKEIERETEIPPIPRERVEKILEELKKEDM